MEDKKLNAQESIKLIEASLRRSSERLEASSAKPLIIWGYVSTGVALAVDFMLAVIGSKAHFLWVLIPLVGSLLSWLILPPRERDKNLKSNPITRQTSVVWSVLGIACCVVGFYFGFGGAAHLGIGKPNIIFPLIALLLTIGMFTTGLSLSIPAYTVGACCGVLYLVLWGLGGISKSGEILSFAVLMFAMQCLVGHYLVYKQKGRRSS